MVWVINCCLGSLSLLILLVLCIIIMRLWRSHLLILSFIQRFVVSSTSHADSIWLCHLGKSSRLWGSLNAAPSIYHTPQASTRILFVRRAHLAISVILFQKLLKIKVVSFFYFFIVILLLLIVIQYHLINIYFLKNLHYGLLVLELHNLFTSNRLINFNEVFRKNSQELNGNLLMSGLLT